MGGEPRFEPEPPEGGKGGGEKGGGSQGPFLSLTGLFEVAERNNFKVKFAFLWASYVRK